MRNSELSKLNLHKYCATTCTNTVPVEKIGSQWQASTPRKLSFFPPGCPCGFSPCHVFATLTVLISYLLKYGAFSKDRQKIAPPPVPPVAVDRIGGRTTQVSRIFFFLSASLCRYEIIRAYAEKLPVLVRIVERRDRSKLCKWYTLPLIVLRSSTSRLYHHHPGICRSCGSYSF